MDFCGGCDDTAFACTFDCTFGYVHLAWLEVYSCIYYITEEGKGSFWLACQRCERWSDIF